MKPTDQELQKIAEKTFLKIAKAEAWDLGSEDAEKNKRVRLFILEVLTQVRDAQENRIFMLEANDAVQSAFIVDLQRNLRTAMEALNNCISVMNDFTYEQDEDSCMGMSFFEARMSEDYFFRTKFRAEEVLEKYYKNLSISSPNLTGDLK